MYGFTLKEKYMSVKIPLFLCLFNLPDNRVLIALLISVFHLCSVADMCTNSCFQV